MTKRRDLRILWSSNAPFSDSGYGIFTRDLLTRLVKDGWPVACLCFWGLQGKIIDWNGIKCYPGMGEPFGSDALVPHAQHFQANVVFTMQDVPTLIPDYLKQIKTWIPYVPIDKSPTPPSVLDRLKYAYRIVTFSRFGQETLSKNGFSSKLILEGTDVNLFKPGNKEEARKKLNIAPEVFLWGMVAANKENPPRKGFQEAMEGFKMFSDKHPEARLLVHVQQPSPAGFPIPEYAQALGIADKMIYINPYQAIYHSGSEFINDLYNSFDGLLHPSQTEGFGLTIVEAQAAGTPVVVQDCHSMPELIIEGKTGEKAKTAYKRFTNDSSFVHVADPVSVYEAMEKVYSSLKANPGKVEKDCREHIVKNYNIDTIFTEQWLPFFEMLQEEILGKVDTSPKKE